MVAHTTRTDGNACHKRGQDSNKRLHRKGLQG